jgi:hypothetical protein
MLGAVVVVFPLLALPLMNLTLWLLPALYQRIASVAPAWGFALPGVSGFQAVCVVSLWITVVVLRAGWFHVEPSKRAAREVAFWRRFVVGWVLSSLVAAGLVSYGYSPEDIAFGLPQTFKHLWIYVPLALFVFSLLPPPSSPQSEGQV